MIANQNEFRDEIRYTYKRKRVKSTHSVFVFVFFYYSRRLLATGRLQLPRAPMFPSHKVAFAHDLGLGSTPACHDCGTEYEMQGEN